ncbi:methionyl aminopeptidase [Maridesulfovibrio ferrireducens]|uniref:Methionine aminopeptidase n=1 Tax=Maridesulfovibrio ferrireducens TaxID=246191 RepID=A0A1G9F5M5_9BACT|nr:type I methionyl aminopeptidase [Maridesulfovibrio ferrireducens]SDK83759.1 methionyl aminopeptidase [Maridesulfovibrio ferrireducens]
MKKYRGIYLKNEKEIGLMREANRLVSTILDMLSEAVRPGISTMALEEIADKACENFGVVPAFKGYHGFPFALCCSVNEEIVHGFPSNERILNEGDIVSIDMGVVYKGFYGDSARTYPVGSVPATTQMLLDVTRESLMKGIEQAHPGNNLYDVSRAIQEYAESFGYGIVRRFVGHGIGRNLHEKPEVPNFVPAGLPGVNLRTGMVIAIEPMVTAGTYEVEVLSDKWTAVTKDRKLSAHFEHTIAITSDGPIILSLS